MELEQINNPCIACLPYYVTESLKFKKQSLEDVGFTLRNILTHGKVGEKLNNGIQLETEDVLKVDSYFKQYLSNNDVKDIYLCNKLISNIVKLDTCTSNIFPLKDIGNQTDAINRSNEDSSAYIRHYMQHLENKSVNTSLPYVTDVTEFLDAMWSKEWTNEMISLNSIADVFNNTFDYVVYRDIILFNIKPGFFNYAGLYIKKEGKGIQDMSILFKDIVLETMFKSYTEKEVLNSSIFNNFFRSYRSL